MLMFFIASKKIGAAVLEASSAALFKVVSKVANWFCNNPLSFKNSFTRIASSGKGSLIRELPLNPSTLEAKEEELWIARFSASFNPEITSVLVNLVSELTGDDCEEILRKLANGEPVETNPYPDVLAIKDGSEVTRVNVQDIQWIDAAGDYMCVHALDGMHIMRKTMKELEQELNPQLFVRVHRSAIANIRFVKKLVSHISGEYHLILQNDTELKVSRSHRDKVKAAMKM